MRLVFHHIPKTGGNSLMAAFRTFSPVSYDSGDTPFLTTHLPFEMTDYPERLHLTILRDPIERLVSWVRWQRTTDSPTGELARQLPTSEFLQSAAVSVSHCARDRQVRQLGGNFYTDHIPIGEALKRALTRLDGMFWVGETETLDADMDRLFDQLELVNPRPDRWNVSSGSADIDNLTMLEELNVWDRRLIEEWHDRSG